MFKKKNLTTIVLTVFTVLAVLTDVFIPAVTPKEDCVMKSLCNLAVNVSYSYIIGFVFYIVAVIPEFSRRKKMSVFVKKNKRVLFDQIERLFDFLTAEGSGTSFNKDTDSILKKINPMSNAKSINRLYFDGKDNYIVHPVICNYIIALDYRIIEKINEMEALLFIADIDSYNLIQRIKNCNHLTIEQPVLKDISHGSSTNTNMAAFREGLLELFNLKNELISYN